MEKLDRISGLDKLLELLTEHCRRYYGFKEKDDIKIDNDSCNFYLYLKGIKLFTIQPERLIFKHFLFIKWLVDKDKIDLDKLEDNNDYGVMKENGANTYKALIMLLAKSDTPIEDLISYLK